MAKVVVNTSDLGGSFELIPVGEKLKAYIIDVTSSTVQNQASKNFGLAQLSVTFKISSEGKYNGREIRYVNIPYDFGFTSTWKLSSLLGAAGKIEVDPEDPAKSIIDMPDNPKELEGIEVGITVGQRSGVGANADKKYNDVTRFSPADDVEDLPAGGAADAPATTWGAL